MGDGEKKQMSANRILEGAQIPKCAHRILWTRVGADICIDIGYLDLLEVRAVLEKSENDSPVVNFHVTDRFFVTPENARAIRDSFNELVLDLERNGILKAADNETPK